MAFIVLLVGSAAASFRIELTSGVRAYERLAFVLLPDQIVDGWCGGEHGRVVLLDRAGPAVIAVWIASVAALMGWLMLDCLQAERYFDRLERLVMASGLGLSVTSLATLAIGLSGGLRQPVWFGLLTVLSVSAAVWQRWRQRSGGRGGEGGERGMAREGDAGEEPLLGGVRLWRWWWLAIPFLAAMAAGAVLPPLDFDVLEYHLQVPKQWYLEGRVSFLSHNVYGNMPLGSEMLAALAMALSPSDPAWWWGALAGKLLWVIYPLLTTALLFAAGRRWFSVRAGAIAALLYVSTPWVAKATVDGLNENALGFYLFASFYAARRWWDVRLAGAEPGWRVLALAGFFTGSAVSCKYTALPFVAVPVAWIVLLAARGVRLRAVVLWGVCVLAACGLWLGKNWVWTGNPTYPLLVNVFGGATRTAEKDAQWRAAHQVPRDAAGRRLSLAGAGQAVAEIFWRDRWQNFLLAPFLVLLVCCGWRDSRLWYWLGLLSFVLAVWWLTTHRYTRFLVPVLPVMALLAGAGATWHASRLWRRTVVAALSLGLAINLLLLVAPGGVDTRWLVSLEQLRDDPRMAYGSHRFLAFDYLNRQVVGPRRVLVVGDAAVFQLQVPVLYNTCFDDCRFETLFRGRTRRERQRRLRELGISHIYIDWTELARYRQPGNYGYSPYVTRELVHGELVAGEELLRPLPVDGLDAELGEIFAVEYGSRSGPGG